jgi:hypothetical protein
MLKRRIPDPMLKYEDPADRKFFNAITCEDVTSKGGMP